MLLDGVLCATNELLVEHVGKIVYLFGGVIERSMTSLAMQQAREVEKVGFLLDKLCGSAVYGFASLGRNHFLVALANDEFGMTDDVVE